MQTIEIPHPSIVEGYLRYVRTMYRNEPDVVDRYELLVEQELKRNGPGADRLPDLHGILRKAREQAGGA